MKLKKISALTVSAALAISMLVGCGGSASSSAAASGGAQPAESGSTAAEPAGESSWPGDTVSLYIPAKAGGGTDMVGRIFAQGMTEVNGGNYIIVNDVTGGGTVAAETVRNASPDGLNLLMYHTGLCSAIASGQYAHTLDEFQILGLFITTPEEANGAIFVPGNSPYNTLEELIADAKAHPGEQLVGIQQGSSSQLITGLLLQAFGIECTMVDAGSNADKVTALMGNQLDWVMMNTTGNDQYVESGDLKCLMQFGTVGCARSSLFPDVPTLDEIDPEMSAAMPRLDNLGYIAGPKGMSEEDIAEINRVIKGAIETDTVQDGYKQMATTVEYVTVEEAEALLQAQQEGYNEAYALVNGG